MSDSKRQRLLETGRTEEEGRQKRTHPCSEHQQNISQNSLDHWLQKKPNRIQTNPLPEPEEPLKCAGIITTPVTTDPGDSLQKRRTHKITDFFSRASEKSVCSRVSAPGLADGRLVSSDVTWLGVDLSHLKRTPECSGPLPALKPNDTHTVMIRSDQLCPGNVPVPFPDKVCDRWSDTHVKMPCSPDNLFPGDSTTLQSRWDLISKVLTKTFNSSHDVKDAILKYNAGQARRWDFTALHLYCKSLQESEAAQLFGSLIPAMAQLALRVRSVCTQPIPLLMSQRCHSITLSQEQVSCLLVNAFFCTFPRRNSRKTEFSNYPDINFSRLFEGSSKRKQEKLKTLLCYFKRVTQNMPCGLITYTRQCLQCFPEWSSSEKCLRKLHIMCDGTIEDQGCGALQKNQQNEEEMEEIKQSLNFMSGEISKVANQQSKLLGLMEEVRELKLAIKEKDKRIGDLERRVDDLEQYSRIDDLIISGLTTRHQTFAGIVTGDKGEDAKTSEQCSLEREVVQFFQSKNMEIQTSAISACHKLPTKDRKTKPVIVIRFANRKAKTELLRQGRKLRGSDVYLNEHLTKKNADIARQARFLKKQNKIQATWTRNCKVWIKLNGSPEEASNIMVDFANRFVGGGVTGSGLVQEEIRFLINPELIAARLFTEVLDDNECLIITGSEQFSRYSGYSDTYRWDGNHDDQTPRDEWQRRCTEIVAMDALHYRNFLQQFHPEKMKRELNKAFCAFARPGVKTENLSAVATGNWGCGAFGGDTRLKAVLQLMAAAEAHRDLIYFTFGDRELLRDVHNIHTLITERHATVGSVFSVLLQYYECVCKETSRRKPQETLYCFLSAHL